MEQLRKNLLPIIAAFIWGTAFVAQGVGAEYLPPFAFNTVRSMIAVATLLIVILIFSKFRKIPFLPPKKQRKDLVFGGICCGAVLTIASGLQQAGLGETDPGKAGFITALYIVLVPIAGIFLKKKAPLTVWVAVVLATVGLYFLCIKEGFTIEHSDFLVLLCAIAFTAHILVIDHFTQKVDGMRLSCMQFAVVALLSAIISLCSESPDWSLLSLCTVPLLYTGVLSSGVAYTLQIISQRGANPTVVSLLMSLESVFAVLAGLVFGDTMGVREWVGCGLMLSAVVFAQLPPLDKIKKKV
ncbi:MAG: DMT family transporter [Clostridia bacterium]|nr:DMT family transporter [Clostridia bacterium]